MPTWRKLHIKSLESHDINDMPDDFTRLLWTMMSLILDKEGRGVDSPSWVKSKVFPLREDVTTEMVSKAMDWFGNKEMIIRYCVNGRRYFFIPTWHTYQSTEKEADSEYPAPIEVIDNSGLTPELLQTNSGVTPELVGEKFPLDLDIDIDIDKDLTAPDGAKPEKPEEKHRKRVQEALQRGIQKQVSLEDRFYSCFHLNVDWHRKGNKLFLEWLKERPPGQTIEKFADWWRTKDWRGKQGQSPTLTNIQELWPQAFIAVETTIADQLKREGFTDARDTS